MIRISFLKITSRRRLSSEPLKHQIFLETPHPQSWAAALLYRKTLARPQEQKHRMQLIHSRERYFEFREEVLKLHRHQQGHLQCHYCENYPLIDGHQDPMICATLDHIVPISRGGGQLDLHNVVICCQRCNGAKGPRSYSEFKHNLKVTKLNFNVTLTPPRTLNESKIKRRQFLNQHGISHLNNILVQKLKNQLVPLDFKFVTISDLRFVLEQKNRIKKSKSKSIPDIIIEEISPILEVAG